MIFFETCIRHDKCYSPYVFLSSPPRRNWICRKCLTRGTDPGWGLVVADDEYSRLSKNSQEQEGCKQ